jgi:DnaJ-class molecular chaperone
MKIPNLGMYHYRDSLSNGDLYIIFDVVFPEKLTNEQKTTLKQCLPKGLLPIQEPNKNVYEL